MTQPWAKNWPDYEIADSYYKIRAVKNPQLYNADFYYPVVRNYKSDAVQISGFNIDWRRLIAEHLSATTSIQGTRQKVNQINGYLRLKRTANPNLPPNHPSWEQFTYDWYGALIVASLPTMRNVTSLAKAETLAAEHFLANARRSLSSFQGGTFVAELGKAIHGIKRPAESLRQYLIKHANDAKRLLRQGRRAKRTARQLNKVISDLWLERQYQWGPLANDMDAAGESLAKLRDLEEGQVVKGAGNDTFVSEPTTYSINDGNPLYVRYKVRYVEEADVRFYGEVLAYHAERPGPFLSYVGKRLGLTLSEVLPTAWELIPFSFVADYFSNTGAMIAAYSFPTANIRWLNRAMLSTARHVVVDPQVIKLASDPTVQYEYLSDNPGSFNSTTGQFFRSPYEASDLLPSFRLEIPGISGWAKWLNLSALANSLRP